MVNINFGLPYIFNIRHFLDIKMFIPYVPDLYVLILAF